MSELSAEERNALEWGNFWRSIAGVALGVVLFLGAFIGVMAAICALALVADGRTDELMRLIQAVRGS